MRDFWDVCDACEHNIFLVSSGVAVERQEAEKIDGVFFGVRLLLLDFCSLLFVLIVVDI